MKPKSQRMAVRLLFLAAFLLLAGVAGLVVNAQQVQAYTSYLTAAENQYPSIIGTKLDSCQLCHPSGGYSLNAYASDYKNAGHSFTAIEQLDSDKDGFTNLVEINALKWPGDASDFPAAATFTPTPTRTNTPNPATSTFTPTPSPTQPGATATWTPTATATQPSPTATPTATGVPASATPPRGSTPTPWPLPAPINRFAFVGEVTDFPESGNYQGNWKVSGRTVRVTAITWLEQPGLLDEHSQVWVLGVRAAGGAVDATYVRILTRGEDGEDSPVATASPSARPSATRVATKTPTPTQTRRPTATFTPTRTPRATATATRTPRPTEDDDNRTR